MNTIRFARQCDAIYHGLSWWARVYEFTRSLRLARRLARQGFLNHRPVLIDHEPVT